MNQDFLLGAWRLLSSVVSKDGVNSYSYGIPPSGQIVYTSSGRMSALLMNPQWADNKQYPIAKASQFFAYGGAFELVGSRVKHHLDFCSVPDRIGTTFERDIEVLDDNTIKLLTEPEQTPSGVTVITELTWQRYE